MADTNLKINIINYKYILKTKKCNLKKIYFNIIPLNIYQHWHTKKMPHNMKLCSQLIKNNNPAFNYFLFDDNDCREFIKNNFSDDVLNAYDSIVPSAFKSDLWRYCILYKNGGIYLDIKYKCINNFKLINLTEKEHFVKDFDNDRVYNALICVKPQNEILLKAINKIVENVKCKFYGVLDLDITGPTLLKTFFDKNEINNFNVKMVLLNDIHYLKYNDCFILGMYLTYREEQLKNNDNKSYNYYWNNKIVYK